MKLDIWHLFDGSQTIVFWKQQQQPKKQRLRRGKDPEESQWDLKVSNQTQTTTATVIEIEHSTTDRTGHIVRYSL